VVVKSSCEAEYMASVAAASQGVWLQRVLEEVMGIDVPVPIIKMDNIVVIALAKNLVVHDRTKHIDVKFHFTREYVEHGDITLGHVTTGDEHTDILTKSLGRVHFHEMRERIRVIQLSAIKSRK
jgi:hypothetical protein